MDADNLLDDKKLYHFLNTITLFIWAYAIMRPGVNALRTPTYPEMIQIVKDKPVQFDNNKFDKESLLTALNNYEFTNGRLITKSMLAWWMYHNPKQEIILAESNMEVEHIYSKKDRKMMRASPCQIWNRWVIRLCWKKQLISVQPIINFAIK